MPGGLAQQTHVARMKKVEAAVGEADRLAGPLSPGHFGFEVVSVEDLGAFRGAVVDQVSMDLVAGEERHAELLDFEPAGHVAERGRFGVVGAAGQTEADDGQHHVAGAGDIVDLPRPGWQDLRAAVGTHEGHPFAVESNEHGLHLQVFDQLLAETKRVFGPADRQPGSELGLEPVGRHAVHAAIAAVVVRTDRVSNHAYPDSPRFFDDGGQECRSADAFSVIRDQDDIRLSRARRRAHRGVVFRPKQGSGRTFRSRRGSSAAGADPVPGRCSVP